MLNPYFSMRSDRVCMGTTFIQMLGQICGFLWIPGFDTTYIFLFFGDKNMGQIDQKLAYLFISFKKKEIRKFDKSSKS